MHYFIIEDLELDLQHGKLSRIICRQVGKGKFMIVFKFRLMADKRFFIKTEYGYLFFKELRFYKNKIDMRYYENVINHISGYMKVQHKFTGICTQYPLTDRELKFIIDAMVQYKKHIYYI